MSESQRRSVAVTAQREIDLHMRPGKRYALRYEIRQRLSIDGAGAVYLAVDRSSGEELQIHILPPRK